MTNQPNLNLLNEMAADIMTLENGMQAVALRSVKEGEYFRRKPNAKGEFVRNHYNPKSKYGMPAFANFSCSSADDVCKEIFLKPDTIVYVEV
jgi:hypothetical protein